MKFKTVIWNGHLHAPFFTFLVHFGYPLCRHAVFLRYLQKTDDTGLKRSSSCYRLAWLRCTHSIHQASHSRWLQHQRVEHFIRLFSYIQQHCSQGLKVKHEPSHRLIGTFRPQTSFLCLLFELFVGRWTQIFIGRPEHPLHQHAPEIAPRSVCVSLVV